MKLSDLPKLRLYNQKLTQNKSEKPEDVVKYLGAIQSQDYFGAKWALALRMNKTSDKKIDVAFNKGNFLRTHALRPTWHFVAPENIKWITKLNAPQVLKIMNYYNKKLDLNDEIFKKTNSIIQKALSGKNFLTREQLQKKLEENGIKVAGQKLGHIVAQAELDLIICSGPRIGKQFTYALIDEVAPNAKEYTREESILKLAEIFVVSRGPATIKDFAKWSGISLTESKLAFEKLKPKFKTEVLEDNKEYFYEEFSPSAISHLPSAILTPNYDEYVSSYADQNIFSKPEHRANLAKIGNALFWNHVVLDGMIIGAYKRTFTKNNVEIEFQLFSKITAEEKNLLENSTEEYGKFLDLKPNIKYS